MKDLVHSSIALLGGRLCVWLLLSILLSAASPCPARSAPQRFNQVIVVKNDLGGVVQDRIAALEDIRKRGQRVEIRGRECLSACTLYLGLPDTCVSRRTSFGFHGPSYYGAALAPPKFEYWSRRIAAHYPEPLRAWYLKTGRTRIAGYYRLSGADLIRMGIDAC